MKNLTNYLKTRRSSLSLSLEGPGPSHSEIRQIIEIASRVPDHGKLAPWRFVLWSANARQKMHHDLQELLLSLPAMVDVDKQKKSTDKLLHAPCVISVISTATEHPKIPIWEQELSAGAACMKLLMAANSFDFEAQWLTAWYVYEPAAQDILQLQDNERLAGIIHIGSSSTPKNERPRPDLDKIFSIREE